MYSKNNNRVRFFKDSTKDATEKVVYGKISEAIKTDKKDADGKDIYEYESWNARFVGKALEKAKALEDNTAITLTEWAVRKPYNKDKNQSYPYIMVMDFEIPSHEDGEKK